MCDFPIGYFPPGQLSRNRGSIDKQHLAKEIQNNQTWTMSTFKLFTSVL